VIQELTSFLISIMLVAGMVFGWMSLSHSIRIRRVRRLYESLPDEAREQIFDQINGAGKEVPACTVLVASKLDTQLRSNDNDDVTHSHYGGIPYAEVNDVWPVLESGSSLPADFLIQVVLDDSFPSPWANRLVVVFNQHDVDQTVRCYQSPSVDQFVVMKGGAAPQRPWRLRSIRIPRAPVAENPVAVATEPADGGLLDYDPVVLLRSVPDLHTKLSQHTTHPADLLAALLAPNHCGYGFELSDIVQTGGTPVWLHEGIEGIVCDQCGRSMRFLFQFGDLNGGNLLGDSGVCYVFGCDAHPDQPRGIVQQC